MKAGLAALAVLFAALVVPMHASARSTACKPGGRGPTRTFCGPAHAVFHDNGKTIHFNEGGNCSKDGSNWSINVGTITLQGKPKKAYFGLTSFGSKPGTHTAGVSWQLPNGTNESLKSAKVTFTRGFKKGTFTGSNMNGGGKASGSFSCK